MGRDALLDALREPVRVCTIIFGEPGIGKTRLLAEARGQSDKDVFYIACAPAAVAIPYDPFIALVRTLHRRGRVSSEALSAVLDSAEQDRLWYLHDALAGAAANRPITIQFDDLHCGDEKSLQALRYCVARLRDLPVTWHLAARPGKHGIVELASSLERGELSWVVVLDGLDCGDLKKLATWLRPEIAFDEAQVAKLLKRTGGNPLYAELLLIAKSLDLDSLPGDLRQTLQQRLSGLSPATMQIAEWLAVNADVLSETRIATLADRSPAQVRAALAELTDEGIVCQHEGGFQFRHDALREACYGMLDEESRAAKHIALARRAENAWHRAAHLDGARRFSQAAKLFNEIGWECLDRHAPTEALNAFDRAIDRTEPDRPTWLEAKGGRAAALFRLGSVPDAKAAMASLEDAAGLLSPDVRVRVHTYYVEAVWDESRDDSILPVVQMAIEEAHTSAPDFLPRLLCVLGSLYERQTRLELARTTLERAISLCDGQRHKRERIRLYSWLGVVIVRLGNAEKGIALLESAARNAGEWNFTNELAQCCTKLCYVSQIAGDSERHEHWCRVGLNAAGPKSKATEASLRSILASVAIDKGNLQEALGLVLTAETTVADNNALLRCRLLCTEAQLYAMLGDFEAAERVLSDGMRLELPTAARRAVAFTAGFTAELREDYERALNWYEATVASLPVEAIREVYEVRALCGIVRVASLRSEVAKARAALDALRSVSSNGWPVAQRSLYEAEGCFALLRGDATGAAELLGAANDGQYPFWRAHLQLIAAHSLGDRDLFLESIETFDSLGAEYAADRARALARSHGLRPGRKRENRGALSAREVSVAFLVANGKTNAEIGELLHVSGRTVEYHIGNILSKCGLRSRVEIAAKIAAGRPLGTAV